MTPICKPPRLLVLGASVRAFATAAARAGIPTGAVDLFRDLDLVEACPSAIKVADYPNGLVAAARRFGASPWCYTGALENRPDLIQAIAEERPLAGSPADAVRRVRDPDWLAAACRRSGISMPETLPSASGVPTDGSFLLKPLASAGGRGIREWTGGAAENGSVWQRRVEGEPRSAAFVASQAAARLLLVTRQLIGWPPCHAGPFAWCGGIETRVDASTGRVLGRLGDVLAADAGLIGLFGVDFIAAADGSIEVLEVNPRPTASMELLEWSGRGSPAVLHLEACGRWPGPEAPGDDASTTEDGALVVGKAVLHAEAEFTVSQAAVEDWLALRRDWAGPRGLPGLADIPNAGTIVRRSSPVLTVFASGRDEREVRLGLESRLRRSAGLTRPCDASQEAPPPGRRIP